MAVEARIYPEHFYRICDIVKLYYIPYYEPFGKIAGIL